MENIFWTGYSNEQRHSAIDIIQKAIAKYGDIVDIHFFSDISITLDIEIEELKITQLSKDLRAILALGTHDYKHSLSNKERKIYLNISFARGTGNLKIDVPAVPG